MSDPYRTKLPSPPPPPPPKKVEIELDQKSMVAALRMWVQAHYAAPRDGREMRILLTYKNGRVRAQIPWQAERTSPPV